MPEKDAALDQSKGNPENDRQLAADVAREEAEAQIAAFEADMRATCARLSAGTVEDTVAKVAVNAMKDFALRAGTDDARKAALSGARIIAWRRHEAPMCDVKQVDPAVLADTYGTVPPAIVEPGRIEDSPTMVFPIRNGTEPDTVTADDLGGDGLGQLPTPPVEIPDAPPPHVPTAERTPRPKPSNRHSRR